MTLDPAWLLGMLHVGRLASGSAVVLVELSEQTKEYIGIYKPIGGILEHHCTLGLK